ncbi:hypothetical protein LUZ60_001469 [Juncus effusus]|nr:hypothetical protein LUZ60_001469 [Juncus effusus]
MGIQGLLPQLKSIMEPIHVENMKGQTVAVDTYSWLHKGALSCSTQLCKGVPTTRHIDYCMHRVNLLRHHGVKPILIFDGGLLPIKDDQETKRARSRKENMDRALQHESAGNSKAAFECYQKAVDISPSIAFELIKVLKREKVEYIVAPYEADAQMAFLSINKLVDAVITEDSDLIPFGCSRIIFKMDKFGQGVEYQSSKLGRNRELDLSGFNQQMLLEMCILSGCDYLPSLPGMGVKRAHSLIQKLKSYDKVIKHVRYSGVSVPAHYEEKQSIAKGIAEGNLDPITKMPFEDKSTKDGLLVPEKTYQVKEKEPGIASTRKKLDLPIQRNILTNYFCLASLEAKRKFRAPKPASNNQMKNQKSPIIESSSQNEFPSQTELSSQNDSYDNSPCLTKEIITPPIVDNISPIISSEGTETDVISQDSIATLSSMEEKCSDEELKPMEPPCLNEPSDPILTPKPTASHYNSFVQNSPKINNLHPVTKKPIVRSSYFKHKETDQENETQSEEQNNKENDNTSQQNFYKSILKRRKLSLRDTSNIHVNTTELNNKEMSPAPVCRDEEPNTIATELEETDMEMKGEGKYGCDISHVNKYAVIAEKSLDKFASLISGFRYNSSGSRASGLRAPLKDVQNTCSARLLLQRKRPSVQPIDITEFSYKSKKKDTVES